MFIFGYLLAISSVYFLFVDNLIVAGVLLTLGGLIAKELFITFRSAGIVSLVLLIAYGYHNEFNLIIIFLLVMSFLLSCTKTGNEMQDDGWGIDFSSDSSDSDYGGYDSGDSGGDGGGGD